MRYPSPKTMQMLREFYSSQSFWDSLLGKTPELRFLDDIVSAGEHSAIPYLAPLLLHRNATIRELSSHSILKLLTGLPSNELAMLDQICRNAWASDSSELKPWTNLKPSQLPLLSTLPGAEYLLGIASFHNNGYVRETAVVMLSNIQNGKEIPFLLLRLNDWVGEVRKIAAKGLSQRLSIAYAGHFVRNLKLIVRLKSCGRIEHGFLVRQIFSLLKTPASFEAVLGEISAPDRWTRREALKLAIEANVGNHQNLLEAAINANDPVLRLVAARTILPKLSDLEIRQPVEKLSCDKSPQVRTAALDQWARRLPQDALPSLLRALFDRHGSVRMTAQYWVKKIRPESDLRQTYVDVLANPKAQSISNAILGLSETGNKQDVAYVLNFLEARQPSFRKAAIRALATLNREACLEQFLQALPSQEPGVSKEAFKALVSAPAVPYEQLLTLFRTNAPAHVRRNCFKLLLRLPFWRCGIFIFETIRDYDETLVYFGLSSLRDWITRSSNMATPPSPEELNQLRNAIKATSGMLTKDQMRQLDFLLRSFKES